MNLDRNNIKKIMFLITFTLVMTLCLFNLNTVFSYVNLFLSVITPFIIGCVMAFIINLPMSVIERSLFKNNKIRNNKFAKSIARPVSLIIALAFLVGIIAIVIGVVLPDLYTTVKSVSVSITNFLPKVYKFARTYIDNEIVEEYIFKLQNMDWFTLLNDFVNVFTIGAGSVISTTIGMVSSVMSTTVTIIFSTVFCIYILLQKETLGRNVKKVLKALLDKKKYYEVIRISNLVNETFSNYVTGQCLDAFILGLLFYIVLLITGMPYRLLIAVLVGFTALIPLVGAFIGCIISMFLLFMISSTKSIIFLVIFIILKQIDENLIYPKVVGSSIGLPSIWVFVALILGGNMWGIIGMILFIPLFSVIYKLFREYINKRIEKKHYI